MATAPRSVWPQHPDIPAEEFGPVDRAIGCDRDIIGTVYTTFGSDPVEDLPRIGILDGDLVPDHARCVDVPIRVDEDAVRPLEDGRPANLRPRFVGGRIRVRCDGWHGCQHECGGAQ